MKAVSSSLGKRVASAWAVRPSAASAAFVGHRRAVNPSAMVGSFAGAAVMQGPASSNLALQRTCFAVR
jgi:hypothetical protein